MKKKWKIGGWEADLASWASVLGIILMFVFFAVLVAYMIVVRGSFTEAERRKAIVSAKGTPAEISCYSGGKRIIWAKSKGRVLNEEASNGYYFIDKESGHLRKVNGDCDIRYNE